MDATRRQTVNMTDAQNETAKALFRAAGYKSFSSWVKSLIEKEAEQSEKQWPEDENKWGDPNRLPNYKK